ncbi:MAG: glycosyltransferase [Acidimicrobiales bacterium]
MTPVTVVVPTYEREHMIPLALQSALDQTWDDFVVLVGDNSHGDATEEVVRSFDDPRILYHRNHDSIGPQKNWLHLVNRADTPLVVTLHDDDLWTPDYLATVVPPMLDDPTIAMTFTDFWLIDQDGGILHDYTESESVRTHRNRLTAGRYDYDRAEGLRLVAVWNAPQPAYAAVIRRDEILATEFPPEVSPLYDIWLSYQLVKRGAGLRYEPQRLTKYRIHLGAITSAGFAEPEDTVFRRILDDNADAGPVTEEILGYWSELRWARATRLLAAGGGECEASQQEFLAAAAGLGGSRRLIAAAAGRSRLAWETLRLGRALHQRRHRIDEGRYIDPVPTSV